MDRLRILLAEDSYANQRLAVGVLSKWGHEVTVANNGLEAVAASENDSFDLVLMDVQMPEMDGFQATAAIRQREQRGGGHLPIIAMTAHAMKGDREECLAAGMDGYVSKPIRRDELLHVMQSVLERNSPQALSTAAGRRTLLSDCHWSNALDAAAGDAELLRQVLESFTAECPQLLRQIQAALQTGDAKTVQRAAHTLKGNLQIFGTSAVHELAQRLEDLGKQGLNGDGDALYQEFLTAIQQLLQEIQRQTFTT